MYGSQNQILSFNITNTTYIVFFVCIVNNWNMQKYHHRTSNQERFNFPEEGEEKEEVNGSIHPPPPSLPRGYNLSLFPYFCIFQLFNEDP